MKPRHILLTLALTGTALAQGPLTPPMGADPSIGPVNALTAGGLPQATMKTLHQVEPRTPLQAGSPGVTQNGNGGFTITAPGSYYMTGNLTVASGHGIIITAASVTLDLSGFVITSTSAAPDGSGIELTSGAHHATLRNGSVRGGTVLTPDGDWFTLAPAGFSVGVHGPDALPALAITVEHLTVSACGGRGIVLSALPDYPTVVRDCRAEGNLLDGIIAGTIERCVATRNLGQGFLGSHLVECTAYENNSGMTGTVVTGCTARRNQGAGIVGEVVSHCFAKQNGLGGSPTAHGIELVGSGSASDCKSSNNSGSGIKGTTPAFSSGIGSSITNCQAAYNLSTGIDADYGTVTGCAASYNGGTGIRAHFSSVTGSSAVSNGEHGISAANGTVSQCTAHRNTKHGIYAAEGVIAFCTAHLNNTSAGGFKNLIPSVTIAPGSGGGIEGTVTGNHAPAP